jgi:cobalt transporter subunit CbtA
VAGLLLAAIQQLEVAPLIRQAEAFEAGPAGEAPSLLLTAAANVVLATGFALLLAGAMSLQKRTGWRWGLLWGLAGYAAFFVAPAIGMPPELPGAEGGALHGRQLWWVATTASTAAGLALVVFAKPPALRIVGLVFIAMPQFILAPQPHGHGGTAPATLTHDFIRAAYIANAIFWLTLGAVAGALDKRSRDAPP